MAQFHKSGHPVSPNETRNSHVSVASESYRHDYGGTGNLNAAYASISPKSENSISFQSIDKKQSLKDRRKVISNARSPVEHSSSPYSDPYEDYTHTLISELEDARNRVLQMEKTTRWWSDCTSNWREKWGKTRDERNKAREENRQLQTQLDAITEQCMLLRRDFDKKAAECYDLKAKLETKSGDDFKTNKSYKKLSNIPTDILIDISSDAISVGCNNQLVSQSNGNEFLQPEMVIHSKNIKSPVADGENLIECCDGTEERLLQLQIKLEESEKSLQSERRSVDVT